MYKIFILDVALLNTFLAAADTDYVNAIIGKGNSHLLINQDQAVFSHFHQSLCKHSLMFVVSWLNTLHPLSMLQCLHLITLPHQFRINLKSVYVLQ